LKPKTRNWDRNRLQAHQIISPVWTGGNGGGTAKSQFASNRTSTYRTNEIESVGKEWGREVDWSGKDGHTVRYGVRRITRGSCRLRSLDRETPQGEMEKSGDDDAMNKNGLRNREYEKRSWKKKTLDA